MPMVLQTDSDVKDDLDKDQINAPVAMMTTAKPITLITMVEVEVEVEVQVQSIP